MAGESVHGLLDVDSAEGDSSEQQLENENQGQMDLYDDLINDIIGVPLNNGLNPEKDNYDLLPKSSSNNIIVPTTAGPIKAAPSKRYFPDKIHAPLPEEKILLIGNLTWWTTGDDLVAAIRSAGIFNVDKIKFYEVPKGGQSKGFVRVTLSSDWDINRLLEMLPKKEVHGRIPDVRHFTIANRQYFETQFINAMEKSKLHSAKHDIFDDHPDGSDNQSASDPLKEANQEPISRQIQHNSSASFKNLNSMTVDSTLQDGTSSPFQQPPVKLATSAVETKLQQGSTPPSPNFLLQDLISLAVPPTNIPGLALSGHRQSQILQAACVDPVTFMTPTNTSLSTLDSNKTPLAYNTCYKDYRIPGRETDFQETLQSKKELIKELDRKGTFSTNDDGSKDDCSEDYGTLLRLVSFVKKSKAIAQDNYRDSLNCPPNQLHGGETKPYSSGLREHEYPRQRENQRSGERSGPLRDRSRSPSSCDGHYREKKMDYDQERQQSHQKIHFENSPRIDHHSDRSRDQRDNFGQERPCDSMRYPSRNSDAWNIYSEKSGKGQDYSPEKYCGIKQEKDREYRF